MSADAFAAAVEIGLRPPIAGPVQWLDETASTNDEVALSARNGAREGLVIGADHQTAGRGRRGRAWVDAPSRSIAMSILLRPTAGQSPGLLPLVVALGVAEGLAPLVDEPIGIVWPNDLVSSDKKLTGILCEMGWQGGEVEWAIAGVGINVNAAPGAMEGARFEPTCLASLGFHGKRADVASAALAGLSRRYAQWQQIGAAPVVAAYRERDALRGREITVRIDDAQGTELVGTAAGIDPQGRLIVSAADGEHRLAAAEVQHLRR